MTGRKSSPMPKALIPASGNLSPERFLGPYSLILTPNREIPTQRVGTPISRLRTEIAYFGMWRRRLEIPLRLLNGSASSS
jgi:hypothetical protein